MLNITRTWADLLTQTCRAKLFSGELLTLSTIFQELSQRFRQCIGVLSELADMDKKDNPKDILRLYEKWLTTRDEHTAERLRSLGMLPTEPITDH